MDERILVEAGLSPNEAKVYTALLKREDSTPRELMEKTGLHSANVYEALERLVQKGLCAFVSKNGKRTYVAQQPWRLQIGLSEKMERLQYFLHEAEKSREKMQLQDSARVLQGREGLVTMFKEILEERDEIVALNGKSYSREMYDATFEKLHRERIFKKIKRRTIFSEGQRGTWYPKKIAEGKTSRIRFLPELALAPVVVYVYGDKVSTIVPRKDSLVIFAIQNRENAESFKTYFEMLWKQAVE
ncbi:MAG: helix-turn-helix domain-containing protein [Candidatus Diapherotrites archaeon]